MARTSHLAGLAAAAALAFPLESVDQSGRRPHPLPPPLSAADKVQRLKLAKAEAEAEIAAYKAERETQFQIFSKEVRLLMRRPCGSSPPDRSLTRVTCAVVAAHG